MKQAFNRFIGIRNVIIKSILAAIGVIMVVASVYPSVMIYLLLTDKQIEWTKTNWILLIVGFVIAVGAAYYNRIIEGLTDKFLPKKNENSNE